MALAHLLILCFNCGLEFENRLLRALIQVLPGSIFHARFRPCILALDDREYFNAVY